MKSLVASLVIASALVLAGCGASGGLGKPVSQFPSSEALDKLADERVDPRSPVQVIELDEWRMQPLGGVLDAPNQTLTEQLAKHVAGSDKAKVSPELSCAAREAARVYAEHGALPDAGLQTYLILRCGGTVVSVQMAAVHVTATPERSDAELHAAMQQLIDEMMDVGLQRPRASIGVGYARGAARATAVIAYSSVNAEVSELTPLFTGNEIKVSGRSLDPADSIVGTINFGQYGVKFCEPDRSVNLPEFRLRCPVAAEDQQTTFSIMVGKKGRVLMDTLLRAMVRRSDEVGLTYRPTDLGKVTQAKDDEQFQAAMHAALNEARARANLKPVKLEIHQSNTNRRVAGQYFKKALEGDAASADLIALGALAGWNVNGDIRGGGVLPSLVPSTKNPARFLGQILDDPAGRWVLFAPEAQSVAIGARVLEPLGLVTLMTTYSFFGSFDHRVDEEAVFEQLSKVRRDNGLPAPTRISSTEVHQALARVASGASTTEDAMNEALQNVSVTLRRPVSGYVMETNALDYLSFPEAFLQPGPLEIAIGVTHYKPPGAAWAQYALLFAAPLSNNSDRNTASLGSARASTQF